MAPSYRVLLFLQQGVDQALALSTVRSQILLWLFTFSDLWRRTPWCVRLVRGSGMWPLRCTLHYPHGT